LVSKIESSDTTNTASIAGTTLELIERGLGRPLLVLHAAEGLAAERPWLELLALRYRVIAPWHPCYGHSPLIDGGGSVDDLAISTSISVSRMLFWSALVSVAGWRRR
jgi:pimeloyl-ACP methyl ester carboxylesterase